MADWKAAYDKSVEARQHLSTARDVAVQREREMFSQLELSRRSARQMERALEDIVKAGHVGPFALSREATIARRALDSNTGEKP